MIGAIKKLFSGILSFLFGLFGGKKSEPKLAATNTKGRKKNGYFLELDESEENQPDVNSNQPAKEQPAKTPQPIAAAKSAITELAKTSSQPVAAAKSAIAELAKTSSQPGDAEPAKAEATKTPQPGAAKPAKAQAAKTSQPGAAKPTKAEKTESANNEQAGKNVELVQTAEGVKAEPAKPAKAPAASTNGQAKTETTFAPKYLNPANSSNGRRRPGPNMTTFLDMARQVKTPG